MSSPVSGLRYEENQIGGAFKSPQTEYVWEFIINGNLNKIVFINPKWSGKNRLIKNGVEVFDKKKDGSFLKNFEIDGHIFSILKYGEKYELRIDNQYFNHLYNLEKNKIFFQSEDQKSKEQEEKKDNQSKNIFKYEGNKNKEKHGILDFKIKIDESNQNSGLKKFKFGQGMAPRIDKNKNIENTQNNPSNNDDIFGLGIINNKDEEKEKNNNNINIIDDIFGYGNNNNNANKNENNNNIDFLNFDSNIANNNNLINNQNLNQNVKSTNEELADIFNAFSQSNNNDIIKLSEEKKDENQININKEELAPSSNNNNINNKIDLSQLDLNKEQINIENKAENNPDFGQINNKNNIDNIGFGFKFIPQESNNFENIEGFKSSLPGFDYESFNNLTKKEPTTNNEKLDNKFGDLFKK